MSRRATPYWPSFHGPKQSDDETRQSSGAQTLDEALRYVAGYPETTIVQVRDLIEREQLGQHLLNRYPEPHQVNSNKLLRRYTQEIKSTYLRSSERLSKVCFDDRLHLIHHALGTQTFLSLPHGGRLKARRELRVSSLFKRGPEPLLRMIVVHELAHLRERGHNEAFYRLCLHMEARYHQLELDARLYLIQRELFGQLYPQHSSKTGLGDQS